MKEKIKGCLILAPLFFEVCGWLNLCQCKLDSSDQIWYISNVPQPLNPSKIARVVSRKIEVYGKKGAFIAQTFFFQKKKKKSEFKNGIWVSKYASIHPNSRNTIVSNKRVGPVFEPKINQNTNINANINTNPSTNTNHANASANGNKNKSKYGKEKEKEKEREKEKGKEQRKKNESEKQNRKRKREEMAEGELWNGNLNGWTLPSDCETTNERMKMSESELLEEWQEMVPFKMSFQKLFQTPFGYVRLFE
ncbi:peptidase C19 family protein, partial [Reticulomyxa filosa]